jgi:hypothetical protein
MGIFSLRSRSSVGDLDGVPAALQRLPEDRAVLAVVVDDQQRPRRGRRVRRAALSLARAAFTTARAAFDALRRAPTDVLVRGTRTWQGDRSNELGQTASTVDRLPLRDKGLKDAPGHDLAAHSSSKLY